MSARTPDGLIADYLAALDRELARAGTGDREDIMAGVEEHLRSELAGLGHPPTGAEVRLALGRLGTPRRLAGTNRRRTAWTDHGAVPPAVAVLTAAAIALVWFPPFLGGALWLAGWCLLIAIDVLVLASGRWGAVARAAIVVLGLLVAGLGFTAMGSYSGDTIDAAQWVVTTVTVVAAVLAATTEALILSGLRDRRRWNANASKELS